MKRDTDNTDFRNIPESYEHRLKGCVFCETGKKTVIAENELAYVIRDGFPVTEYHSLIIPKRHTESYFDLGQPEINAVTSLTKSVRDDLQNTDRSIDGFNVGVNSGSAAGQTIFHCHIHLIPRRTGDDCEPRGGVRHVIPAKAKY
jgi:diadenosine tetraphosphate (Ap4A) HIT family hydrolase